MASSNLGCVGTHGDAAMIYSPHLNQPSPQQPNNPRKVGGTHTPKQPPPQPPSLRHCMQHHRPSPRRLPHDRHPARIPPELGDVVLHPLEREFLV